MSTGDLASAGAAAQAEAVRRREISVPELVGLSLARIDRLDGRTNAFSTVLAERAVEDAARVQTRVEDGDDGPLLGVPVAVKDDTDVAGTVTAFGTGAGGAPATADAEVVRHLRAAGAIVVGKTNVPELDVWPFTESVTWGATRNPWDLARSPGGSSGGSGAAVAAGLVGAALGSDAGGSIRIPAAWCGVVGLKPQLGRVSYAPRRPGWHGLSVYGPLAPTVRDAALFLDAATGTAEFEPASKRAPGTLRIGVSTAVPPVAGIVRPLDPGVRAATERTAAVLRALGHRVVPCEPDYRGWPAHLAVRYLHGARDDARSLARPDRLERRTRQLIALAALAPHPARRRVHQARLAFVRQVNRVFEEVDVLLTPVAGPPVPADGWSDRGLASTLLALRDATLFTPTWNIAGNPALALPAELGPGGLPIGVQLVGRPHDEATLLSLGAQLEAERPWAASPPAIA